MLIVVVVVELAVKVVAVIVIVLLAIVVLKLLVATVIFGLRFPRFTRVTLRLVKWKGRVSFCSVTGRSTGAVSKKISCKGLELASMPTECSTGESSKRTVGTAEAYYGFHHLYPIPRLSRPPQRLLQGKFFLP